jgi:pimeloyl-ACP methyl ester carboxylesterase
VETVRRSITNDDWQIVFDEGGEGPTVVWLHGLSEDRWSWEPVTRQLLDEMRCIRIDFRGHGESTRHGPYDAAGLVSDLASVTRATCTEPPVVVGHSLGGMVATIGAASGVTGPVVCVDQPLCLRPFDQLVRRLAARLRGPTTYADALIEEKMAMGMGRVPEPLFGELERKFRASDREVVLDIWKPMLDADAEVLGAADDFFALLLAAISVPYLALHGLPVEAGYQDWFQSTNPNAAFEAWDGIGHWLHLVDPNRFAERFREFLTQGQ